MGNPQPDKAMHYLRLAFRALVKTPFVTTVATLSLALGIGANTAIFSLFHQILLQALPVYQPDRLVNLSNPGPKPGSQSCNDAGGCDEVFSYAMFRDLEQSQTVLTGLAAHWSFGANLSINDAPLSGSGVLVSGSYFPTLGVTPALGRLIGPADDETIGGSYVAVLAHGFWRSHFGSDPQVVGKTLIVNGQTLEIIGVAPEDFTGTTMGVRPLVYMPITMRGELQGFTRWDNRRVYWAYLFGRLKDGVSLEQASSALNALYRPILQEVEAPLQSGMSDATMEQFLAKELVVKPGPQGQSSFHANASAPLLALLGVTGVVLLIACANIANLLLVRGAARSTEMGMRLALGSGRGRVIRQLLTEAVLLAAVGGVASLLVALATLKLLARLLPPEAVSTLGFTIQPEVILFTGLVALVTGLLFGLFPALHSSRSDLITVIRAGAGQLSASRAAARFRAVLVTVQIALATGLLISAGLFLKSLVNVARVELGVEVDNVVTFSMAPQRSGYDSTRANMLFAEVEQALFQIPGVTGVTSSMVPLLAGSNWGTDVHVQGFLVEPDTDNNSRYNEVGAGYFQTMGVPLIAGREFTMADGQGAPQVAIVNETFAEKFELGREAVGKFMSIRGGDSLNIEIVGLIPDIKYSEVKDPVPPLFYIPWRQDGSISSMSFYLRTQRPPEQVLREVPDLLGQLAPTVPLEELKTMPQQIRENVFLDRMISILSAAFATLATILAAVGLYGVLAYTVQQRTREIGVRMSLGAEARHVRALVLKQVGAMLGFGGVLGLGVALAVGKALSSLLFGMKGNDPVVFSLSLALLGLVALGAAYLPARRASRVEPTQALRYE